MSAATVATAPKSAAALRFLSADTTTGIVAYATPSTHDVTRINIVSLDTETGATFCTCKAGECHKACWHRAAVIEAWAGEVATQGVIWLTDAQLVRSRPLRQKGGDDGRHLSGADRTQPGERPARAAGGPRRMAAPGAPRPDRACRRRPRRLSRSGGMSILHPPEPLSSLDTP